jgi:3-oxoacyl-[acyl-carrier protein] reductase
MAGSTAKVALVTGSSRGIGRAIALALAADGCDIMLTGRDETALAETSAAVAALGRVAQCSVLDLREPENAAALADAVAARYGRLDILVNNAGSTRRGDFLSLTDADWHEGFALKFFAHVRLSRAAWPMLRQSSGSMVFIAGTSGRMPSADFTIGSSVNAACAAFAKALADRGKTDGVQVNCVNPSYVETERLWKRIQAQMTQTGQTADEVREDYKKDMGFTRIGTTDDVSALVSFLVSPRGRWMHGATVDIDGGEVTAI